METQKRLINAFAEGRFEGSGGTPPERVTTLISNLFLTGDTVYKFYKDDSVFFNQNFSDLSGTDARFSFTHKDFDWNHALSPEVYLKVVGVHQAEDGMLVFSDHNPQELVIVMKRLDMKQDGFLKLLLAGRLTKEDFFSIGKQLAERMACLTLAPDALSLAESFPERLQDAYQWARGVSAHIPLEEVAEYEAALSALYTAHHVELTAVSPEVCVDIHGENAAYVDQKLLLIDTYQSKDAWQSGHPDITVYRLALDAYVLSGESAFRAMLKGYEKGSDRVLNSTLEPFFIVYNALIMAPYLYMLAKNDPQYLPVATRYHQFLRTQTGLLRS
jgi:aminoglycoside phosphotransferase family enzyme